jgi:hypothetical protein
MSGYFYAQGENQFLIVKEGNPNRIVLKGLTRNEAEYVNHILNVNPALLPPRYQKLLKEVSNDL